MITTPKRCFAYTRVSTKQQLEGDGFGRQIAACKDWAERHSWNIVRIFQEQQTGTDEFSDRKLLTEAMALASEGSATGVTAIVVERADRIARDLIVGELFFRECRKAGIKVYAADSCEELVNATGDPTRKLIRQILGALGEWEKSMLVLKLQSGRRRKKAQTGKPCGGPGLYRNMDVIREIILLRRTKAMSYSEIADHFNMKHYPTPWKSTKEWVKSTVWMLYQRHRYDECTDKDLQDELQEELTGTAAPLSVLVGAYIKAKG